MLTTRCFSSFPVWFSSRKCKKNRDSFRRRCPLVCFLIMIIRVWWPVIWLARIVGPHIIKVLKLYLHFISSNIKTFAILNNLQMIKLQLIQKCLSVYNMYKLTLFSGFLKSMTSIFSFAWFNIFWRERLILCWITCG